MKRTHLIAAFALLAAAATCLWAAGPLGVVTTTEGVTYEGEITESDQQVVVRAHGVDTVVARGDVLKVDYTSYADRFDAALKALAPDDAAGRIDLAREAFDRREYELAQRAVNSALEFDPMNRAARQLDAAINAQVQMEGRSDAATTTPTEPAESAAATTRPARRVRGLNEAEANRVRQLELTRDDSVHIQFRDNVRKRYVDSQPDGNYRAFAGRTDVDQALTIINNGTSDMTDDIYVRGDPRGIQSFGRHIQTAVVQGCATANCHGGNGAGSFRLMSGVPDPSMMITNFYLLTQYAREVDPADAKGVFTPNSVPMVDRGNAKNSLLYQYALPRARAKQKHPLVRNWDGLFRDDNDRLARDLVTWMDVDLARIKPDYGFQFKLGSRDSRGSSMMSPTSAPATTPAE